MAVPALLPLAALATAISTGIGLALRVYIVAALLKLFVSIGIGFYAWSNVLPLIENLQTLLINELLGLPADWLAYASILRIDEGITILFSAFTVALTIKGLRLVAR